MIIDLRHYSSHSNHFDVCYLCVTVFGQVKRLFFWPQQKWFVTEKKCKFLLKSVRYFIAAAVVHVRMVLCAHSVCIAMVDFAFLSHAVCTRHWLVC